VAIDGEAVFVEDQSLIADTNTSVVLRPQS
jgi:hypothetical protein